MKIANIGGRAVLVGDTSVLDVHAASDGAFGPDVQEVYERWDAFRAWADGVTITRGSPGESALPAPTEFDAVVPRPRQVFAVGLNYRAHALESGLELPDAPLVFTKFPASIAAPVGILELPTDQVDWEVELTVVIGREARRVTPAAAWDHVAGLTAAQDYSARDVQLAGGSAPQFSVGKSFAGFLPLGPVLTTPDEYPDRDDIELSCRVNGETVQSSTTADLIFPVPELVSYLSHVLTLYPGDLILTGTPSGVGLGMKPPRYLRPGDVVDTVVAGVGSLQQHCVAPEVAFHAALQQA
ncbi:fumarylacetoacetate hydrolase family protein [Diaminobutyricibacter tongyongensis]|uniref:Fumarylacetoacetate hydrolase family protein n=1 Tax=Leifsonia tongyongensis TaxID=1268043 RepID=A0A6L9Y2R5_9MICO|nr:fumarylacetoacetate hydrolase family protein [Diaminobutyricibacter tongyongensis]NEN07972.1 fumarylacetoacetate hydrolase family protein [Diaminobutyricibacter tongyongensis]